MDEYERIVKRELLSKITALEAEVEWLRGEREEAFTIFAGMYNEYNRDEQCDGVRINRLIERGHVLMEHGAQASRDFAATWHHDEEYPDAETEARDCARMDIEHRYNRVRQELFFAQHNVKNIRATLVVQEVALRRLARYRNDECIECAHKHPNHCHRCSIGDVLRAGGASFV